MQHKHEANFKALDRKTDELDKRSKNMQVEIDEIKKKMELSTSASSFRQFQLEDAWGRAPDSTKIRLNAECMVHKPAILAMLDGWLSPLGYKAGTDYKLHGGPQPLSKSWTISFTSDVGTATRQVNKSLQALNNDGEWTKLMAEKPSDHCDEEGQRHPG